MVYFINKLPHTYLMFLTIFFIKVVSILYKLKSTLECLILEDLWILLTEVLIFPD